MQYDNIMESILFPFYFVRHLLHRRSFDVNDQGFTATIISDIIIPIRRPHSWAL